MKTLYEKEKKLIEALENLNILNPQNSNLKEAIASLDNQKNQLEIEKKDLETRYKELQQDYQQLKLKLEELNLKKNIEN